MCCVLKLSPKQWELCLITRPMETEPRGSSEGLVAGALESCDLAWNPGLTAL